MPQPDVKALSAKANAFRAELLKLMPGYHWTVHKSSNESYIEATGTQSSGFNRIATLSVVRTERGRVISYEVKSSGYGLRAPWLHQTSEGTLARALRQLQDHYEGMAATYGRHAADLRQGRPQLEPGDTVAQHDDAPSEEQVESGKSPAP